MLDRELYRQACEQYRRWNEAREAERIRSAGSLSPGGMAAVRGVGGVLPETVPSVAQGPAPGENGCADDAMVQKHRSIGRRFDGRASGALQDSAGHSRRV